MKITMKDIAKEAGVSAATVSHVINGTKNITEDKRNKILDIIEKYNYSPNSTAKNLRKQNTKTAGLVVSSFPDTFVNEMVYGVEERAREKGYNLLLINTNEDEEYEQNTFNLLYSKMVDGIILSPASNDLEYLNAFTKSFPIVLVNRFNSKVENASSVTGDNFTIGYDAAKHMIEHGHKDIGIIYSVRHVSTTEDRIEGYKEALKENGLKFHESYLEAGHATVKGGAKAVESLLKREKKISDLLIQNDLMTIGAISKLKELSIRIPEEVALIGFGDFASSPIITPPITNMVLPPHEIGRKAFDSLLKKIEDIEYMEHIELPASMFVRQSCGCD